MEVLAGLVCFFFFLAVAVVFVTVIGHGLWVMFAAMFGSNPPRRAHDASSPERESRKCVGCGDEYSRQEFHCPFCGLNPDSVQARELKDLHAALRAIDRLQEQGALTEELVEAIEQSVETRRVELAPRRSRGRTFEPTAVAQLEEWFGAGEELSIEAKKSALALARTMPASDWRKLSATTLVGVARLQASVGMLSRACAVYQVLFDCHAAAEITADAAVEAIRLACKLEDWARAESFARSMAEIPGLLDDRPELAALVDQMRARDVVPEPTAPLSPLVEPVPETPAAVAGPQPVVEAPLAVALPVEAAPHVEPPAPAAPRRRFSEWIAVFMEEKNILWGELIGGTLIVGCSIALVISLWQTLEQIEFFPFLGIAAVTSALFGAGFYTLHHWKLESTSRGLLLIGTLLVPLDFLVLAGLTSVENTGWLDYLTAIVSLGVFGWFLYRAARILIQTPLDVPVPSALLVAIAMIVSAMAQLVLPAWMAKAGDAKTCFYVLSLLPVIAQVSALGWILLRMSGLETWSIARLAALLIALGGVTFACTVTLSFPLYRADDMAPVLPALAPALTLLGVPILLTGILIHQKLAPRTDGDEGHGLWRTLGTGLALTGLFVMFGGFTASVGDPVLRWLCGLVNIGTLLAVAWSVRVPMLHVPAQVYLAILLVYGGTLDIDAMMNEPIVALRLTALLVVQALAAEAMLRLGRRGDGRYYAVGSGVTTVLAGAVSIPFISSDPGVVAIVLATASLTWLAANLRWRYAEITYACSLVFAGAIFFAFRHVTDLPAPEQLLWTMLTHATVLLTAGTLLRFSEREWLRDFYRIPLQFASLLASFVAAAVVLGEQFPATLSWPVSCWASCWLAALWLTLAVLEGWPLLFGAFQLALAAAWIFGAGGWLVERGWDWREPYSLHLYGIGIAAGCLGWEVTRMALRPQPRFRNLLSPGFVPIDRLVSGGLIIGQYILLLCVISFGFGRELSLQPDAWRILPAAWHEHAYSLGAWVLPLLLVGVLVIWMRELDWTAPLVGFTLLALTLPLLIAGTWFDETLASASAARWGLALGYGTCSLALWQRHRLGLERAEHVPALVLRALLAGGAIVPILFVTIEVAARKLAHVPMPGPLDESIFIMMGGPLSLLIPLTLLSTALAGHGFRERLSYYLLAAGLLANASSIGGYFLALPPGMANEPRVVVDALLLAAGVAWLWSIVWTWLAGVFDSDGLRPLLHSILLTLNNLLGAALYGLVLLTALVWIIFLNDESGRLWTLEAGSPWSGVVFTLMAAGTCFASWRRRATLSLHQFGLLSLTAVGVIACSVETWSRNDSFIALMFLCGVYACVWVWSNLFIDANRPPRWLDASSGLSESVVYSSVAGALAVFLGCGTFFTGNHPVWSAESIALAALACGLLAFQRKTEIWATLAVPLSMLATTILTLHFANDDEHRFLLTVQLNLAVVGALSLVRLALHRFLAPDGVELSRLIHLPAQIALGMACNGFIAAIALMTLIFDPKTGSDLLHSVASWAGWLAFAVNAAAALWQVGVVQPRTLLLFIGLIGLQLGVMAAGSVDWLVVDTPWLAHHVLTISWTAFGVVLVCVSWTSHTRGALDPHEWPVEFMRTALPASATRVWVGVFGALVVAMSLRAAGVEPAAPHWPVGNTFAVSVLLGAVAIWSGNALYHFASGLLFNVIGVLLFAAWATQHPNLTGSDGFHYFLLFQAISCGAAAIVWSILERVLERKNSAISHGNAWFTQIAILGGLALLAAEVVATNGMHLAGAEVHVAAPLAWIALGGLLVPTLFEMWRPVAHRFTRVQLYVAGLLAIGIFLHGLERSHADWCWYATLLLSGYVLAITASLRAADFSPMLQDILLVPAQPSARGRWFWQLQIVTIAAMLMLSIWITLTFETWHDRLGGALACTLVTLAAFLLAQAWPRVDPIGEATPALGLHHRHFPMWTALTLGVLIAVETCWAFLDPTMTAVWLQRSAAALTVVAAATVSYRLALPRLTSGAWSQASRGVGAALGVVCLVLVANLLARELLLYDADPLVRKAPLRLDLVIGAAVTVLGVVAAAFQAALSKEADPYSVEGERRSLYVYLGEVLALALFAHLRLNVADIFAPVIGQRWYFVVMVLAFALLALSEYFQRKAIRVLATPLYRSAMVLAVIPVLAFRLAPLAHWSDPLSAAVPGLSPFLRYLKTLAANTVLFLPAEAVCWLLLGIFFSALAGIRKSANYGIVAALAINFGVWVLLGHQNATAFLERPQLWLIPLGLIVLVAEFVNRDRLGFWPAMSVRYVGLLCIYLSSTFEMFREMMQANPIYPIALALLAVAGMLLGILFRVRAFLLSGFLALLIVIFAQIWNAAVYHSHTWVWWASGILLGVVILAMFALFEKHRNGVLHMIDSMKRWN